VKVAVVGGGPAGLFFSALLRRADPDCEVVVHERNRRDDPFGFGVVFSDATGSNIEGADAETFRRMSRGCRGARGASRWASRPRRCTGTSARPRRGCAARSRARGTA